jgi:hypothetical protein
MDDKHIHECIVACWDCRHECQKTFFTHCLEMGKSHLNKDHIKAMIDCIQICQITADFLTRHSDQYSKISEACATICESCAKSCEKIGDEEMLHCAEMCRKCAEKCHLIC